MHAFRCLLSPESSEGGAIEPREDFATEPRAESDRDVIPDPLVAGLEVMPQPSVDELKQAYESRLASRDEVHARERTALEESARAWEQRYKAAVRDRELATSLAGRALVAGAPAQLLKLWRDEFDVIEEGGATRVMSREGKDLAETVSAWLERPEYAHFRPATTRGGSGLTSGVAASGLSGVPEAPRNLGEAALSQWREGRGRAGNDEGPIGLHRRPR